jgi:hypothetical protein
VKVTPNLIQGELHLIHKQLHLPFTKQYHKAFYDNKFMNRLERSLGIKYPQYEVAVAEYDTEYVLRIVNTQ